MSSKKSKWKNSVQKARRVSQSSSAHSTRKSSIIGEETTANELEEYLETLKKKSGVKSLWRGDSFDRVVRDEEDKTPDISISSTDDHEELGKNLRLSDFLIQVSYIIFVYLGLSTLDHFFSLCVCSTEFSH